MKWMNHKLVNGAFAYALTGDPLPIVPFFLGSVFPDMLEGARGAPGTRQFSKWTRRHRRWSHWFVPYAVACGVAYWLAWRTGVTPFSIPGFVMAESSAAPYALYFASYFLGGCLLHIAADGTCGTVPSADPTSRIGLRLFEVGSAEEFAVALSFAAVCLFARLLLF